VCAVPNAGRTIESNGQRATYAVSRTRKRSTRQRQQYIEEVARLAARHSAAECRSGERPGEAGNAPAASAERRSYAMPRAVAARRRTHKGAKCCPASPPPTVARPSSFTLLSICSPPVYVKVGRSTISSRLGEGERDMKKWITAMVKEKGGAIVPVRHQRRHIPRYGVARRRPRLPTEQPGTRRRMPPQNECPRARAIQE